MKDNIREDILLIEEMLNITQDELAKKIGVDKKTISFSENKKTQMTLSNIKKLYDYAFDNNIHLNKIKSELYIEENKSKNKILFHGSKGGIDGELSSKVGRINNDFGQGFYTGESYEQSASFVSMYDKAYIYILEFDQSDLKCAKFDVDTEWMLAIAYFRGTLNEFKGSKQIKKIIDKVKNADYIIAPIADNRMFRIIDTFIAEEITDEQCKHCLSATNLGYQYVFLTDNAIKNIKILEECVVCDKEKEYYKILKEDELKKSDEKVKVARIKYRGKGKYIEEILK